MWNKGFADDKTNHTGNKQAKSNLLAISKNIQIADVIRSASLDIICKHIERDASFICPNLQNNESELKTQARSVWIVQNMWMYKCCVSEDQLQSGKLCYEWTVQLRDDLEWTCKSRRNGETETILVKTLERTFRIPDRQLLIQKEKLVEGACASKQRRPVNLNPFQQFCEEEWLKFPVTFCGRLVKG